MALSPHLPVMPEQVIAALRPESGGSYIDLTAGTGGHARLILEASAPDGRLLAIDRDAQALELAEKQLASYGDRLRLVHGSFSELPSIQERWGFQSIDGMLADLGVSSLQLDQAERGFSLQRPGPLDMRMDPSNGEPLGECLKRISEEELAEVLRRFGDVPQPRRMARRILEAQQAGRLTNTVALAEVAAEPGRRGKLHPATRVFMALRMMVNQEAQQLMSILDRLPDPLKLGGRVVFIAFHSIEDRWIKTRLAALEGVCRCPSGFPICSCGKTTLMRRLNHRVVLPSPEEEKHNPRARSARLRAAERVAA